MSKKTIGILFKVPALLLLIASFLAGIYAAVYNIQDMGWEVPIILGVVLVLYGIGSRLEGSYYKQKLGNDKKKEKLKKPVIETKEIPRLKEQEIQPEDIEEDF